MGVGDISMTGVSPGPQKLLDSRFGNVAGRRQSLNMYDSGVTHSGEDKEALY